jgi:hypothetical protein
MSDADVFGRDHAIAPYGSSPGPEGNSVIK